MINNNLLQYLCCPRCKSDLINQNDLLVCEKCKNEYKIQEGIPILVDLDVLPSHLKKQIEYFEKEDNNRLNYRLDEWQRSYIRRLDENLNLTKNDILIDIGTGSGYIAVEMAKRGINVIACDLTLKELVKLKKVIEVENLQNNLFLVCCSAESLPFKSKIANCVVSNAVIEHLPKEKEAIYEMNRVCKEISSMMITVPLRLKYNWPMFWIVNYIHDKRIGHLRRYDEKILLNKFNIFGYTIKKVYYTGHFTKIFKTLFNDFIWKIFNLKIIENQDNNLENKKYGASNICVIFNR